MSIARDQIFIEQAEYIESDSFELWSATHPDENKILKKLSQGGAKLISGPRGCGKTTLLLKAFKNMLNNDDAAFPVYVNFKRSLSVEPLYKAGTDGTYWFNQWVILKIYIGIYETLESLEIIADLKITKKQATDAAAYLEMSNASKVQTPALTIADIEKDLTKVLEVVHRGRCTLLLDDAAHAFSPDQQRDFFDFFRQIKSKIISPKAAVYPGVTTYSSSFHVGHDAEQIDVWIKPDRPDYITFMLKVMEGRLAGEYDKLTLVNKELVQLLCYASYGVPRALLNMLQAMAKEKSGDDEAWEIDLNRANVIKSIKQHYVNTQKLFTSLSAKIPVYNNFITTGTHILSNAIELVKNYNKNKPLNRQSVAIAISENDLHQEYTRVFNMLQYAGLCIPRDELISRGEKGRFKIFSLHYAGLISNNALVVNKSIKIVDYIDAFKARDAHAFTRTRLVGLLGRVDVNQAFLLSLPPCSVCGALRPHQDARFCISCGSPLTSDSTYQKLLKASIAELPLTEKRVQSILDQSSIKKIKDILLDDEHKQLLKVDRIGKVWAAKIHRLAEEFVE